MLNTLKFKENWRCFKAGDTFDFRPGVNLLVGDQGCGKSSLLQAIAASVKSKKYQYDDLDMDYHQVCCVCGVSLSLYEDDIRTHDDMCATCEIYYLEAR